MTINGKCRLIVIHFCWSINSEFFLTLIFCSSRSLFFIRSARALFDSASLFSSSRMLSCSSFTSMVRWRCGSSLHSSTSGRRSRFFSRDCATFNGGWMLPTEIFNRSMHFSMSLISWNRNRHMGVWQLVNLLNCLYVYCISFFWDRVKHYKIKQIIELNW